MALSQEAQSLLRSIRADVDNELWIQGCYTDPSNENKHCLVGFVRARVGIKEYTAEMVLGGVAGEVIGALKTEIERRGQQPRDPEFPEGEDDIDYVIYWNDDNDRTEAEVVELIDGALLHS